MIFVINLLAIGPVITIDTVLLAIAKLAKPTNAPIPACADFAFNASFNLV
jgi:hypothetical protein